MHEMFGYQKFSETRKGSPTKFVGTDTKKLGQKIVIYPSLIHRVFRYPNISETPKGSSTKSFGTVRQNNLDGKSLYLPFSYP